MIDIVLIVFIKYAITYAFVEYKKLYILLLMTISLSTVHVHADTNVSTFYIIYFLSIDLVRGIASHSIHVFIFKNNGKFY